MNSSIQRWCRLQRVSVERGVVAVVFVSWFGLIGCGEPLQHGLEEPEANAMVVALNQNGVDAQKIRDPGDDDRWAVEVPSARRVEAWTVLEREGFPRPEGGGFEDFYPGGGLIPTAQEERVVYQYATAQELESSLLHLDRVVDAHVHLVLPEEPRVQMADDDKSEPRASVLVQWTDRGDDEVPIDEDQIRQLVSGAVEDLDRESVHVVMTPIVSPAPESDEEATELVQVGPVAVAPESQGLLRGLVLGMGGIVIALSSALVYILLRHRRMDSEGESS